MRRKWSIRELARRHAEHSAPDQLATTVLWLHNIRSMHNVGSVFRSADGFGIKELWLSGHTPTPPRPEIHKTALGADRSVPWRYFSTAEEVKNELNQQNRLLIGVEQTTDSVPLQELVFDPSRPICVVFGNEVTGLDEDVLALSDIVTEIPQFGKKHSLNVSVAAGVVLYGLFSLMETQARRP